MPPELMPELMIEKILKFEIDDKIDDKLLDKVLEKTNRLVKILRETVELNNSLPEREVVFMKGEIIMT